MIPADPGSSGFPNLAVPDRVKAKPVNAAKLVAQEEEEEARALGAVLAVEWPERLGFVPEPCWRVELKVAGEGRMARLRPPASEGSVAVFRSDATPPPPAP